MAGDDVTLGEVVRRLDGVQKTMDTILERLDKDYVRASTLTDFERRIEDSNKDWERRIASLEESRKWVVTLVLGLVIAALLGAVLVKWNNKPTVIQENSKSPSSTSLFVPVSNIPV